MSRKVTLISVILAMVLLATLLPACRPAPTASAYTAIIPAILQAGSTQKIPIALFAGENPTSGQVKIALLKNGQEISQAQGNIDGRGEIKLNIPEINAGDYIIQVKGTGFQDEATVKVANNYLLFLESDKPIYKPGQTIHMRVVALNPQLMPTVETITVDVLDAKGIKIFRQVTRTDDFGMATIDLPISTEPNLGNWKIITETPKTKTQLDVKVEEYVLPKYEVTVDLPKSWFLVNEPIKCKVTATYSFGKPVEGELEIIATKYVGTWQNYANIKLGIDGETEFVIPAVNYVAGVPAAQGNGNVKLQFSVKEQSTGYLEKTDRLLTVAQSSTKLEIIPAGITFKPGLPYSFMVISETPDNQLIDTSINTSISFLDKSYKEIKKQSSTLDTTKGKAVFEINPPADSIAFTITCSSKNGVSSKTIEAAYSPSSNFIHLEQISEGTPAVGDNIKFYLFSTKQAANFYYEIIARGTVVFSDYTNNKEIVIQTTPAMAPSAKLLVYQILPNAEIAADYIPFKVAAQYPQNITLAASTEETKPGDNISINIQTQGPAEVGLVAVDKSVFILAENRMNLQQVFDELEKLYMQPQAEIHEVNIYNGIENQGAKDVFREAGVIVLSNKQIPEGKKYESPVKNRGLNGFMEAQAGKGVLPPMAVPAPTAASAPVTGTDSSTSLAEVQRVRQYFPETWIWNTVKTNANGKASLNVTVPDTITTWMLRAVAISTTKGLGIAENQLRVFQPFFLTTDLPYSAIRGEEFPVKIAIYNYLDKSQNVVIQIQPEGWFDLLGKSEYTLNIEANDIGGAEFMIKPTKLGTNGIKITARSSQAADAVVKTIIIEPEGVAREIVNNIALSAGKEVAFSTAIPGPVIEGSARGYLAVTASYLTQTLDGLESLLQMPFGCGEQNMILLAPNIYVTRYLKQSGQLKPELMAKAEKLMLTGYQKELTYRRSDGSFSAFGQSDKEGSLWLTAFVLKTFSQAKGLIYIDEDILNKATAWILSHQNPDGSFDSVGFVHHQEMVGGIKGKAALTAYVTTALLQAGKSGTAKSISYLENQLAQTDDPYTVALITYALELAKSAQTAEAHTKLMKLAQEDENGLHWGSNAILPSDSITPQPGLKMMPIQPRAQTSAIEATAYAALMLLNHGDALNASRAAKWLVSKRNAYGGYGSTQDTILSLQALTEFSSGAKADVDLTITVNAGGKTQDIKINPQNSDILQIIEIPENDNIKISVKGRGEAIGQIVQRYNVPGATRTIDDILKLNVVYNADSVSVNDQVNVAVDFSFNPPEPIEAGMLVVDIAVPTGFGAVKESVDKAVAQQNKIKRYDISGRKVIFYIENMSKGDRISFNFQVIALYPVKAKAVASQAYSYYKPEINAESLSQDITVVAE